MISDPISLRGISYHLENVKLGDNCREAPCPLRESVNIILALAVLGKSLKVLESLWQVPKVAGTMSPA